MADKQSDPAEAFRNLITEWERGFDAMANRIMGTDEFSRGMHQLQDLQLGMQKRFAEAMAQQLSTLNIPSRDDVLRLGESMRSLDKRLANIVEMLARQAAKKRAKKNRNGEEAQEDQPGSAEARRTSPPRTKLPPSQRRAESNG